ncbi:hypothetical protein [Micromonospora eburnea]|uniref:PknH-like extracellular domain-containing protein n=1 Tax=Micromonospora eburnea TaxID=227316 RepID=A0A1C6TWP3_9ACTN|nr:hypothetical protein [Micromonospora eburnea]SCL46021.1 hypothetical protein GA0070604_1169 [Micromonospora eburnea]
MNRIVGRQLSALAAVMGILLTSACGSNSGISPTGGRERPATLSAGPYSTDPAKTGVQPLYDLSRELDDQVGRALIGPALDIDGVTEVPLQSPYMDDLLSGVCGTQPGNGVYLSAFGQRREWKAPHLRIQQFAGGWGVSPAAEAVARVRGQLGCGTYRDREGLHRILGERELSRLSGLDDQLMFCEVINEKGPDRPTYLCTVLVARGEVASRIQTWAATAERAEQVTRELAAPAAQRLAAVS